MTPLSSELNLAHGTRLVVTPHAGGDAIRIEGPGGQAMVTIDVTEAGATVRVAAPSLRLEAPESIELAAPRIRLEASESLDLASGDAATLRAGGLLESEAHTQHIRSARGDVKIDANDDVRLDGERVMVNCDQVK